MKKIDLPNSKELDIFNSRLAGAPRSHVVKVFNPPNTERLKVRPMGHLSSDQFREIATPSYFESDWDSLTDEVLEKNVDYKMEDLRNSIKQHGVIRPVVIDNTHNDDTGKFMVIDGNHRAHAAVQLGLHIPTYALDKSVRWNWYG